MVLLFLNESEYSFFYSFLKYLQFDPCMSFYKRDTLTGILLYNWIYLLCW